MSKKKQHKKLDKINRGMAVRNPMALHLQQKQYQQKIIEDKRRKSKKKEIEYEP